MFRKVQALELKGDLGGAYMDAKRLFTMDKSNKENIYNLKVEKIIAQQIKLLYKFYLQAFTVSTSKIATRNCAAVARIQWNFDTGIIKMLENAYHSTQKFHCKWV